jgi:hypothetical protein
MKKPVMPTVSKNIYTKNNEDEENIYSIGNYGLEEEYEGIRNVLKNRTSSLSPKNKVLDDIQSVRKYLKGKHIFFNLFIGPTPKANEVNQLAPKINKNHILENRNKVTLNEIPKKPSKNTQENQNSIHKDFGKTPEYLQKYKQEAEDKKEMQ